MGVFRQVSRMPRSLWPVAYGGRHLPTARNGGRHARTWKIIKHLPEIQTVRKRRFLFFVPLLHDNHYPARNWSLQKMTVANDA